MLLTFWIKFSIFNLLFDIVSLKVCNSVLLIVTTSGFTTESVKQG